MRVALVGVGRLDGLWRGARVLGFLDGVLPVAVGVLEEDHVPVLLARRAALPDDVPEGDRRLKELELRLQVRLAVLSSGECVRIEGEGAESRVEDQGRALGFHGCPGTRRLGVP